LLSGAASATVVGMRPRSLLVVLAIGAAIGAASPAVVAKGAPSRSTIGGACSRSTAVRVLLHYRLLVRDPSISRPIRQVLCGAFSGPGSRAMAVSLSSATCRPVVGWEAFRLAGGGWQRLPGGSHPGILLDKIVKSGSQILEVEPKPRKGETVCLATDERSRPFRWNGSRLVPGPWTVIPGVTVVGPGEGYLSFLSPGGRLWCEIEKSKVANDVFCGSKDIRHRATLHPDGRLEICHATAPDDVCLQNWGTGSPVLAVGQSVQYNGFRCVSSAQGVACTVGSGAGAGKGFLMTPSGEITAVGG
jgi:hypothetical protein